MGERAGRLWGYSRLGAEVLGMVLRSKGEGNTVRVESRVLVIDVKPEFFGFFIFGCCVLPNYFFPFSKPAWISKVASLDNSAAG
jgi:hypothetical protein